MTHLEKTREFLNSLGIDFEEEACDPIPVGDGAIELRINDWAGGDVHWTGYWGFFFYFTFNSDGSLASVGAGE